MPTRIVCSSARRTRETLMAMDLVPTTSIFNDKVSSSSSSNNNTVVYLGSIYHYAGMDGVFGSHVKQLIIGESETFEEEQTDEVVLIVGHNRGLEEAVKRVHRGDERGNERGEFSVFEEKEGGEDERDLGASVGGEG